MKKKKRNTKTVRHRRIKKTYEFTENQCANIILAARGKSGCPTANKFVKKIDTKIKRTLKKRKKK